MGSASSIFLVVYLDKHQADEPTFSVWDTRQEAERAASLHHVEPGTYVFDIIEIKTTPKVSFAADEEIQYVPVVTSLDEAFSLLSFSQYEDLGLPIDLSDIVGSLDLHQEWFESLETLDKALTLDSVGALPIETQWVLEAEMKIKGRVKTMSGKSHRPRKLIRDKNITPEAAAKKLRFEASGTSYLWVDWRDGKVQVASNPPTPTSLHVCWVYTPDSPTPFQSTMEGLSNWLILTGKTIPANLIRSPIELDLFITPSTASVAQATAQQLKDCDWPYLLVDDGLPGMIKFSYDDTLTAYAEDPNNWVTIDSETQEPVAPPPRGGGGNGPCPGPGPCPPVSPMPSPGPLSNLFDAEYREEEVLWKQDFHSMLHTGSDKIFFAFREEEPGVIYTVERLTIDNQPMYRILHIWEPYSENETPYDSYIQKLIIDHDLLNAEPDDSEPEPWHDPTEPWMEDFEGEITKYDGQHPSDPKPTGKYYLHYGEDYTDEDCPYCGKQYALNTLKSAAALASHIYSHGPIEGGSPFGDEFHIQDLGKTHVLGGHTFGYSNIAHWEVEIFNTATQGHYYEAIWKPSKAERAAYYKKKRQIISDSKKAESFAAPEGICLFCDETEGLEVINLDGWPEELCETCRDPDQYLAESFAAKGDSCVDCGIQRSKGETGDDSYQKAVKEGWLIIDEQDHYCPRCVLKEPKESRVCDICAEYRDRSKKECTRVILQDPDESDYGYLYWQCDIGYWDDHGMAFNDPDARSTSAESFAAYQLYHGRIIGNYTVSWWDFDENEGSAEFEDFNDALKYAEDMMKNPLTYVLDPNHTTDTRNWTAQTGLDVTDRHYPQEVHIFSNKNLEQYKREAVGGPPMVTKLNAESFEATTSPAGTKGSGMSRLKADAIINKVKAHMGPHLDFIEVCGSYRRGNSTPKDLDFVVIPKEGVTLPNILPPNQGVNWVGDKKAQVVIDNETIDFRVSSLSGLGASLMYFTGPAGYNIGMRVRAKKMGLKLNEYGVFDRNTGAYIAGATEADVYQALGKPYKSPDLRGK